LRGREERGGEVSREVSGRRNLRGREVKGFSKMVIERRD
jgi:hypothetical protein